MADHRLSNEAIQALSRDPTVRAVSLYRGILNYARAMLAPAAWFSLLWKMDEAGLPLPTELNSLRAINDRRKPRALLDLVYAHMVEVDSNTVGNHHISLTELDISGDLTVVGDLAQQDNTATVAVASTASANAGVVAGGGTFQAVNQTAGIVEAQTFAILGEPVEAGDALFTGRTQAPYFRLADRYSKQAKLPDNGALFADLEDRLWASKVVGSAGSRTRGVGCPTFDSGWFGALAHFYDVWQVSPLRLAAAPPNGMQIPVAEPGDANGVVDVQILIRGLAIWPDGYFGTQPWTFREGTPGRPWYSRASTFSENGAERTSGCTIAIDDEGNVRVIVGSGSTWLTRELDVYCELRVLLWMRGSY